ncbi:cysteine hydrolase family protein [Mycobacterium sp. GA-2829]|uniref:cysteine hydrolase family protein n=1 Tax=Mycobacterium sp. GA-2829 TaxID=1772283 RepID=UPI00073FCA62|nr:cysteine hydrolase [Mycobacterium sp. GA-2829]KUI36472.1 isochorismatase [Mycobacterium sp. GA-2829]
MTDQLPQGRTALLLMDLMEVLVPKFGGDYAMLDRLREAAAAARRAGVDVVHVRLAFRPGFPDVAASNRMFSAIAPTFDLTETNPATGVHPALAAEDSDITVVKKRVSAFAGSDLDIVLRSRGVTTLVLAGVTTSGVVLSTLRAAADLDYRLVVLSDGCGDGDEQVHRMLMDSVFPANADVMTVQDWTDSL